MTAPFFDSRFVTSKLAFCSDPSTLPFLLLLIQLADFLMNPYRFPLDQNLASQEKEETRGAFGDFVKLKFIENKNSLEGASL